MRETPIYLFSGEGLQPQALRILTRERITLVPMDAGPGRPSSTDCISRFQFFPIGGRRVHMQPARARDPVILPVSHRQADNWAITWFGFPAGFRFHNSRKPRRPDSEDSRSPYSPR